MGRLRSKVRSCSPSAPTRFWKGCPAEAEKISLTDITNSGNIRAMPQASKRLSALGEDATAGRKRRELNREYQHEAARLAQSIAIADLVILHRTRCGLTQKQLADRMKTSVAAISRLESGRHSPSLETLRALAEAVGKRMTVTFDDVAHRPTRRRAATAASSRHGGLSGTT